MERSGISHSRGPQVPLQVLGPLDPAAGPRLAVPAVRHPWDAQYWGTPGAQAGCLPRGCYGQTQRSSPCVQPHSHLTGPHIPHTTPLTAHGPTHPAYSSQPRSLRTVPHTTHGPARPPQLHSTPLTPHRPAPSRTAPLASHSSANPALPRLPRNPRAAPLPAHRPSRPPKAEPGRGSGRASGGRRPLAAPAGTCGVGPRCPRYPRGGARAGRGFGSPPAHPGELIPLGQHRWVTPGPPQRSHIIPSVFFPKLRISIPFLPLLPL